MEMIVHGFPSKLQALQVSITAPPLASDHSHPPNAGLLSDTPLTLTPLRRYSTSCVPV